MSEKQSANDNERGIVPQHGPQCVKGSKDDKSGRTSLVRLRSRSLGE